MSKREKAVDIFLQKTTLRNKLQNFLEFRLDSFYKYLSDFFDVALFAIAPLFNKMNQNIDA